MSHLNVFGTFDSRMSVQATVDLMLQREKRKRRRVANLKPPVAAFEHRLAVTPRGERQKEGALWQRTVRRKTNPVQVGAVPVWDYRRDAPLPSRICEPPQRPADPIDENDIACSICERADLPATMLLCDGCNRGFHMHCVQPRIYVLPENDWFCLGCKRNPKIKTRKRNKRTWTERQAQHDRAAQRRGEEAACFSDPE